MRVLLDTNVLVAAFATRGLCEDVLRITLAEHELVVGETVLTELERILVHKLRMPVPQAKTILAFLRSQADVIKPVRPAKWPKRDLDDRWVVAAAVEGGVDFLVTGDRDVLEVAGEISVSIASPRSFWEQLR